MSLSKFGVDYHNCTYDELKKFIQTRGSEPKKWELETILREADKDAVFKFLELPPELRNIIYNYVFEVKAVAIGYPMRFTRVVADTAILRTCKQICTEASGLLYAQYEQKFLTFKTLLGRQPGRSHHNLEVLFNGHPLVSRAVSGNLKAPQKLVIEWPTILKRACRLRISMDFASHSCSMRQLMDTAIVVNDFLHQLNQYTSKEAHIDAMLFDISNQRVLRECFHQDMCSPIPTMASRCPDSEIICENVAGDAEASLKATTATMRTLRSMEDKIRGVSGIRHGQMQRFIPYDQLMLPMPELSNKWHAYVYAPEKVVKESISGYKAILEEVGKTEEQRKGSERNEGS